MDWLATTLYDRIDSANTMSYEEFLKEIEPFTYFDDELEEMMVKKNNLFNVLIMVGLKKFSKKEEN